MSSDTSPDGALWFHAYACFFVIFFMLVAPALTMQVLFTNISNEMDWSRTTTLSFASFKYLAGAIAALSIGAVVMQVGAERVVVLGGIATSAAMATLIFVNTPIAYIAVGLVLGATGFAAHVTVKSYLSRYFSHRLGVAVGVAYLGGSAAGLCIPLLVAALAQSIGWRETAAFIGLGATVVMAPAFLGFAAAARTHARTPPSAATPVPSSKTGAVSSDTWGGLVRNPAFRTIITAHLLIGAVDLAMLEHTPIFVATDLNLGQNAGAITTTLVVVIGAVGKLYFGWLFDRYSMHGVAMCWYLLAFGVLLAFPVAGSATLGAFALVRGLSHGGVLVDPAILAAHNFPFRDIGKVNGAIMAAHASGGALSVVAIASIRDLTGDYTLAFIGLIACAVYAASSILRLRPRLRN